MYRCSLAFDETPEKKRGVMFRYPNAPELIILQLDVFNNDRNRIKRKNIIVSTVDPGGK